ncbi:MAG: HAD family hydrolase [Gammaproteobacteria bacterium]
MSGCSKLACVLFDLDGTLLDTAPDLIASLNRALHLEGLPLVASETIRPYISFGATAMVKESLNGSGNDEMHCRILEKMLNTYQEHIAELTVFFNGMPEILERIESRGIKWGVVTNKLIRFTAPLMAAMNLTARAACIVSGDSTAYSKPHPEPMLAACRQAGVAPGECVYIGDSAHDIVAGKSAGMKTVAAAYGYLKPGDNPREWGADALVDSPSDLLVWLDHKFDLITCR